MDKKLTLKMLELIGEVSKTAGWCFNTELKNVSVTGAFYHILEAVPEPQLLSARKIIRLIYEHLNQQQRYSLLEANRHCLERGEPYSLRFYLPHFPEKKWIKVNAWQETRADGKFILGTLEDVTEVQKMEEQVKLFQKSNDKATQIILWVNHLARLVYANELALQLLQCKPADLKSLNLFRLFPKTFDSRNWENTLRQLRQERMAGSTEKSEMAMPNAVSLPVEMQLKYVRLFDKDLIFIYARENGDLENLKRELAGAKAELENLKTELDMVEIYEPLMHEASSNGMSNIITQNPAFLNTLAKAKEVATADATVLLLGETGTGKELLAAAIHRLSHRKDRPLQIVNCAALSPTLIESELFGHEKGAFTGAHQQKIGRFEQADGGTLLLDEIGELPLELQPKLLRVLQDGTFQRVGSNKTKKVNVRILAATNQDLAALVKTGQFRRDLFYRLHVFPLTLPPLRERREDIPLLARHFVKKYNEKSGKLVQVIPQSVLNNLAKRDFPGNVRELENVIERAIILSKGDRLEVEDGTIGVEASSRIKNLRTFEQMQREFILETLQLTNWRVSGENGAARLLNLNHKTLETKMRKLGIKRPKLES